jgi:hypothetical protein
MNYFKEWILASITPVGWVLILLGIGGLILAAFGVRPFSAQTAVFAVVIVVGLLPSGDSVSGRRRGSSTRKARKRRDKFPPRPHLVEHHAEVPDADEMWQREGERREGSGN